MKSLAYAVSLAAAVVPGVTSLAAAPREAPAPAVAAFTCPVRHNEFHGAPAPLLPVQDYEPKPAMWKISDEDTAIYVFGTYHVLPESLRWRTPLFDKVMAEAKEVVFESIDDDEPAREDGALSEVEKRYEAMLAGYRGSVPLSQQIAPRNRAKLAQLFTLAGIAPEEMELEPPVVAMFAISDISSAAEGSFPDFGVETVIEKAFRDSGRPVSAIEDPVAVMESFLKLDPKGFVGMIDQSLDEWDGCSLADPYDTDWSGMQNWARGKIAPADVPSAKEDPFGRSFYEALIVNRNRAWADWLTERMKRPGNVLLAVGAAHMEAPDSVLLMLEARGIKAERVQ